MVAYSKSDYYHALMWLQEAGTRLEDENPPTINAAEVLAPLAVSLDQQDNKKHAIRAAVWLSDVLDAGDSGADKGTLMKKYPDVEKLIDAGQRNKAELFRENLPQVMNTRPALAPLLEMYEALCRNDQPQVSYRFSD